MAAERRHRSAPAVRGRARPRHRGLPAGDGPDPGRGLYDGTWYLNRSTGKRSPGELVVAKPEGGPAGALRATETRRAGIGPEDLSFWPAQNELWTVTEHARRPEVKRQPAARCETLAARLRVPVVLACALALLAAAPAAADASWGAIAVDRSSGNSAGVSGYATASAAGEAARSQCQGSCSILVTVRNACGVVLDARGGYFAGRGSSVRRATRRAARRAHARSYRRIASVCSN